MRQVIFPGRIFSNHLLPVLVAFAIAAACPANAAEEHVLGIAAPLSGTYAPLGEQLREGAVAAIRKAGLPVRLVVRDDGCRTEGGVDAAQQFLDHQADLVVGFLCTDAIEGALPLLAEAGIVTITPGVRASALTDQRRRRNWLVYRLAPRADAEREAVAQILTRHWADVPFAIVDDGTIHGRDLADSLRLAAEQARISPVLIDSYQPGLEHQSALAARLGRAGASHVFVGGDRLDIALLGKAAAALGHDLVIAGGEALRAARTSPDLAPGTLMVGLPEPEELANPLLQEMQSQGIELRGYALPAHAAVEIAISVLQQGVETGETPQDILDGGSFKTAMGTVEFDANGNWRADPYGLFSYDGERFARIEP